MTTEVAKKAEQRLEQFEQTLSEYDHDGVKKLCEAVAESSIASLEEPDLSVEEWLAVLEELAGEAYATAYESNHTGYDYDFEIRWFLRHDGEAFVYGTRHTGELYRGKSAERQIRAVVENHDVHAYPMEQYPIEESDTFAENDP